MNPEQKITVPSRVADTMMSKRKRDASSSAAAAAAESSDKKHRPQQDQGQQDGPPPTVDRKVLFSSWGGTGLCNTRFGFLGGSVRVFSLLGGRHVVFAMAGKRATHKVVDGASRVSGAHRSDDHGSKTMGNRFETKSQSRSLRTPVTHLLSPLRRCE
jgi:hypothetical protein